MAKTDDDVRNLLTREAEKAGELHVDVRDVERRVGARRNMGSVLAVAAVVAVVAGVAAGVSLTRLRSMPPRSWPTRRAARRRLRGDPRRPLPRTPPASVRSPRPLCTRWRAERR